MRRSDTDAKQRVIRARLKAERDVTYLRDRQILYFSSVGWPLVLIAKRFQLPLKVVCEVLEQELRKIKKAGKT